MSWSDTVGIMVVVQWCAVIYLWRQMRPPAPKALSVPVIERAVRTAYAAEGLPEHLYGLGYDLKRAGKWMAVCHHAAVALGKNPDVGTQTVEDVIAWLSAH